MMIVKIVYSLGFLGENFGPWNLVVTQEYTNHLRITHTLNYGIINTYEVNYVQITKDL